MFGLLDSAHVHLVLSRSVYIGNLLDTLHHRWRLSLCCVMEGTNIVAQLVTL